MRVTMTSPRRYGLQVVLLAIAVVLHALCAAGHPADAAESPTLARAAASAAPDHAVGDGVAHTHAFGEGHHCADGTDDGTDQRTPAWNLLQLLLGAGLAVVAALCAVPLLRRLAFAAGTRRARRRNAAHLLLTLCVWRV
ncbi:hypothetical protein ACFOVU_06905 [Nocardiopsis sediminis]|uniref:Uncharacterized protein n=1 Tax=Nocardiopsis sediminis TaxID=1778267 RepID=A0ABV8FHJ8_9ACTN